MEPKEFLNRLTCRVTGVPVVEGKVFGLELELEGHNVALNDVATRGWRRNHDGSLRGGPGNAIEYTTQGSKSFEDTQKLVTNLFKKFKEHKIKFNDSIRTSTHVHLNFSDKPIKQAFNFFILFTMLEEVLQHYSGEDRKGNLFCISTREAEGIMGVLASAVARCDFSGFAGDRYKYSACNLSCLYKFGTVEVRTMRGAVSADQVNTWVSILNDMYEYSLNMVSPVDLVRDLSLFGADELMKRIFKPENYKALMSSFPAVQTLHYSLMEGARIIQVFAYEFNDAFMAKYEEQPPKEKNEGNLPVKIVEGRWAGNFYQIYIPETGIRWNIVPNAPGQLVWVDGQRLPDEHRIFWDGALQRFVYQTEDGRLLPCSWRRHHNMPDEGPFFFDAENEDEEDIDFDEDVEEDF